jgi:hypothetical protein
MALEAAKSRSRPELGKHGENRDNETGKFNRGSITTSVEGCRQDRSNLIIAQRALTENLKATLEGSLLELDMVAFVLTTRRKS